jgi:hypothetical protein
MNLIEKVITGTVKKKDLEDELTKICDRNYQNCLECPVASSSFKFRSDECPYYTDGAAMLIAILERNSLQAPRLFREKHKKQAVAWNKERTRSVVLAKLKEFTIQDWPHDVFCLKGWFNKDSFFTFGDFNTKEEAEAFLQDIHDMY